MEKITALFLILFSITNVMMVIAILYGANIVKEWGNAIVDRIEALTDKIEELEKKITEMESKKESDLSQAIKNQILTNLRERWSRPQIRVQDDDKPLDFPNDHKE